MLETSQFRAEDVASAGQSRLVRELSEAAALGREAFIGFLRHQLGFASSDHLEAGIDNRYDRWGSDPEPLAAETGRLVRAGIGVYLFSHHAERWRRFRDPKDQETVQGRANDLLSDPDVRDLLFDVYELDEQYRDASVKLHEAGTTSFILRLDAKRLALKIIKPWYFDDDAISQQTRSYKETYGFLQSVIPGHFAWIYASNRHSIVMDYIDGNTLRELFSTPGFEAISEPGAPPSPQSLVSVLTGICSLLGQCAAHTPPISHDDLSATNILIRPTTGELFLIDFGENYLRSRLVGTADQRSEISYLHSDRTGIPRLNGDVDALGVILAEGLLGGAFAGEDLQPILDDVYKRYPSIGYFLDDLFHRNATSELPAFPLEAATYNGLSEQIREKLAGLAVSERVRNRRKLRKIDDLSRLISPINLTQTASLVLGLLGVPASGRRRNRDAPLVLRNLTWVPVLFNWFAIVMFFLILGSHIGNRIWPDIIGWACTVTYSVIAARYCVFVFADLDLSDWPGRAKVSVPVTCVLIWPPILFPLLIDWSWWAISVAVGTSIIAVNNEICVRSCNTMKCVIVKPGGHISRLMARAMDYLVDWRQLMAIFSGSMFVLSLLLWLDVLQDGLFYGVLVAAAPAGKMYLQQTGSEAPIVRAGLHRLANAYRQSPADATIRVMCEEEANRTCRERWGDIRRRVIQKWDRLRTRKTASSQ
jgi:serine/threonine protein kinase